MSLEISATLQAFHEPQSLKYAQGLVYNLGVDTLLILLSSYSP